MQQQWLNDIQKTSTSAELEAMRLALFGKQGAITQQLKLLGTLSTEERKAKGAEWNAIRQELESLIKEKAIMLHEQELITRLSKEKIDVTLPPTSQTIGRPHILTRTINDIIHYFGSLGFSPVDGPEIDDTYHNFDALNIPALHPARQSHDTFYISHDHLLRTHTSAVQIRALKEYAKKLEGGLRCLAVGRVYRSDAVDATHTPMFHQIEGLVIEKNIHFGHLKGCVTDFCEWFFGCSNLRFRTSFFPFTEPSAEVDIAFKDAWLEVMGCGMVHPSVLERAGLDPNKYSGFAFGMGAERLAMLRHGITDIRHLYDTDMRWLEASPGHSD